MANYMHFEENEDGTTLVTINIEDVGINEFQMLVPGTLVQMVESMVPAMDFDAVQGPLQDIVPIPNDTTGVE